jgi:putative hydrolase of the HAD superfamily
VAWSRNDLKPLIRCVILDLDDTLLDHRRSVATALLEWLPGSANGDHPHLLDAWLAAERRHYPAWQTREISFAEQRRRRLRDFLPLIDRVAGDDADLDDVFTEYLACYQRAWVAFDDVQNTVNALTHAGFALAVLTNGTVGQQNAKLAAIGLAGRVGPVLTAEELRIAKPEPGAYLAACERLGLTPASVLHVGDQYELDVIGPRRAGLHAVHLDRLGQGPPEERERLSSLTRLPDYLAKLG